MDQITEEEWQKMSPEEKMEHQIKNCIFCKIIKGEIPSKKIYEDNDFVGVLDINPGTKGHTLLLSKKHVQIMPQLGTELNGKLGIACKNVSNKITDAIGVSGTSIFVANGAVAGQNAPHFMMHIIPRKENDNIKLNPQLKNIDVQKISELRQKVISALGLPVPENENKKNINDDRKNDEIKNAQEEKKLENNKEHTKQEEIQKKELKENEKPDKELLDKISKMFD